MRKIRDIFRSGGGIFSVRRYGPPKQYLRSMPEGEDLLAHLRNRSDSALAVMQDPVVNDSIRALNEQIMHEIVRSDPNDDRVRTMLYLKLQVTTEFQEALLAQMNEYESLSVMREQQRRHEEEP